MEPLELPADFAEVLRSLNDHGVEYLLVGGFAVAVHGYPRATADLDVPVIGLEDLRRNKLASGRAKDLADLEELPEP